MAALAFILAAPAARPQSPNSPSLAAPSHRKANPPAEALPHTDKTRAHIAYQAGRRAEQAGDLKMELTAYSEAAAYDPQNREYAMLKEHARFQVVQSLVDRAERQVVAGDLPGARALLHEALLRDPNYSVAQERLAELAPTPAKVDSENGPRLAGLPRLMPKPGMFEFDYHGTTRGAYEEIGKQFGVTMVFDGDLQDRSVHFQVPELDFDTAVMVLSRQTRTFARVVDAHTMFVTDDTPQKEKDYALEVEKQILLPASVTTEDMNEAVRMIREMTGIARTQLNTSTHTLTVRSTEQNVALAQALLEQVEQPRGEVMLEIEILEVDRALAHQLGIVPPTSSSLFALTLPEIRQLQQAQNNGTLIQILQQIFGSGAVSSLAGSALPALIAFGGGKSIFLATMPGATADFSQSLNAVRSAQRILIRAQDGKPATFFVGDRYPVSFGLLSSGINPESTLLNNSLLNNTQQALLSGASLPRTDYDVGKNPISVAIADFNGDSHPDIAVANQGDGTIWLLRGNGDGTFNLPTAPCSAQPSTTFPSCFTLPSVTTGTPPTTTAASPSAIALGDFDNDGNTDIAVTDAANNLVYILLGNGDGTFKTAKNYATGKNPVALVAQDFDGDGEPDLAVVNQTDGTVTVLLGNKVNGVQDGTFAVPPAPNDKPLAVGGEPSAIATGIFVNSGFPSLAVTNNKDNTVSILIGQTVTTGGVQQRVFAPQVTYPTGNGPAGIALGTFNLNTDSNVDLAITNETDGTVSVLLGNGDGTFKTRTDYAVGSKPVGVVAATFAGSAPDLAVADSGSDNVDVLIGKGDGTFVSPISLPTGNAPIALVAADLAGGGAIDLVTADNGSNQVTVTLNTAQSTPAGSPGSQTAYPSVEYLDLGLKVKATPRLHADDEVTLQLQFDIKSLTGSDVNGIPVLSNRNIEQTIRLHENETSVLAGLIERTQMKSINGTPWISTAPGIGYLTGENTSNEQDTEMLIVVTPHPLRLPPHDVPALYAGRGEPTTPPAPPPGPVAPPTPPVTPQPGQPSAEPGQQGPRGGVGPVRFPGPAQPGQVVPNPGQPQQPPEQAPPQPPQQQQ